MRVERVRLRIEQLAIHVARDRSRYSRKVLVAARLVRVAVRTQAHRIVVAELFEMRHAPLRIGRVAVKSAAQLIEYSTGGNFSQRVERHRGEIRMPEKSMRERELNRREVVESRSRPTSESPRLAIVRCCESGQRLRAHRLEPTDCRLVGTRGRFELCRGS